MSKEPATSSKERASFSKEAATSSKERASSSKEADTSRKELHLTDICDDELQPCYGNDEEEIARLGLPEENEPAYDDDRDAKIEFKCSKCDMHEMVHYFGRDPPFVKGVGFLEDTYVMRDPRQPPAPRGQYKPECWISIGSHCSKSDCSQVVCKDHECSFFYAKTYCLPCALKDIKTFPVEVQAKLKRRLASKP